MNKSQLVLGLLLVTVLALSRSHAAESNFPEPPPIILTTTPWEIWESMGCGDVQWDEHCKHHVNLDAPDGYQICKALVTATGIGRGATWGLTAERFVPEDPLPQRFRRYKLEYNARGSNEIWDRWGSNITFGSVGLLLIEDWMTNEHRNLLGCDMPTPKGRGAPRSSPFGDSPAQCIQYSGGTWITCP